MAKDYYDILGVSKETLKTLADAYGIERIALFGSFVRGEQTQDSDIDLLIEFDNSPNRFQSFMGLKMDMEEQTGRKVDLVTPESLHWYLKERVLKEARDIL